MALSDLETLQPRRSWEELIGYSRRRGRALRRRRSGVAVLSSLFAVLLVFAGVVVSTSGPSKERLTTLRPTAPAPGGSTTVDNGPGGVALPTGAGVSVPPRRSSGKGGRPAATALLGVGPSPSPASVVPGLLPSDRVAFTSNNRGQFAQIDVTNADGTGRAVLSHDMPFNDFSPTWSPDGRMLAFVSDRDNTQRALHVVDEVYVMNADGSGERRLTYAVAGGNGNANPAWSPDGGRIAFDSDDAQGHADIWTVRPDGTGLTNLTHNSSVEDYEPSWSPDGARIAFVRYTSGASQLWVMNADGSDQRQVSNAAMSSQRPAWSPDGRHIAFDRTQDDGLRHVWVMDADGSNARAVVTDPGESSWPTWSPDGGELVFGYDPNGSMEPSQDVGPPTAPAASGALYVVKLDASGLRRLTAPAVGASDYAPAVHRS